MKIYLVVNAAGGLTEGLYPSKLEAFKYITTHCSNRDEHKIVSFSVDHECSYADLKEKINE